MQHYAKDCDLIYPWCVQEGTYTDWRVAVYPLVCTFPMVEEWTIALKSAKLCIVDLQFNAMS